jgi:hypothetical protein
MDSRFENRLPWIEATPEVVPAAPWFTLLVSSDV